MTAAEITEELIALGSLVRLADGTVVDPFAPTAAALAAENRRIASAERNAR